MKAVRNVSLA